MGYSTRLLFATLLFICSCAYRIDTTAQEVSLLEDFFFGALDLDKIQLWQVVSPAENARSFTRGNRIYFVQDYETDREMYAPLLIHEAMHVWQNQNYGRHAFPDSNYHFTLLPERHITSYGLEEQASMMGHLYRWKYKNQTWFNTYCDDCAQIGITKSVQIAERRRQELKDR